MRYAAVRIIDHVSGRHVWEIGRFSTVDAARHARNGAIEEAAHHLTRHSGKDGLVAITPLPPLTEVVTLWTADRRIEVQYVFTIWGLDGLRKPC